MKIVAVRANLKKMALKKPYTIAYNTFTDVALAFLEIELANGMIGYGSGSPADCSEFEYIFCGKFSRKRYSPFPRNHI